MEQRARLSITYYAWLPDNNHKYDVEGLKQGLHPVNMCCTKLYDDIHNSCQVIEVLLRIEGIVVNIASDIRRRESGDISSSEDEAKKSRVSPHPN